MLLAIVIPVYNERTWVRAAVERVLATPAPAIPERSSPRSPATPTMSESSSDSWRSIERRIFLIDDGSIDGTSPIVQELAQLPNVTAIKHERNRGKGAALRTGFKAALDAGADVILIHDADMEYDPADHAEVLAPILDGRADMVVGSRFLGHAHRVLYYWHYLANQLITTLCDMATNLNLTDIECCSKAFTRDALSKITIEEDRFGVEPELIAKAAKVRLPTKSGASDTRPLRIYEVPVSYAGRTFEEGKKITWRDGVSALRCIVKYWLMR